MCLSLALVAQGVGFSLLSEILLERMDPQLSVVTLLCMKLNLGHDGAEGVNLQCGSCDLDMTVISASLENN